MLLNTRKQDLCLPAHTETGSKDLFYDSQTSGGLLFAVNKTYQYEMMKELSVLPTKCAVIGEVVSKKDKAIIIRP